MTPIGIRKQRISYASQETLFTWLSPDARAFVESQGLSDAVLDNHPKATEGKLSQSQPSSRWERPAGSAVLGCLFVLISRRK